MSPERKTGKFYSEQERLGKPDFTGSWQGEKLGGTGAFKMYILKREPTVVRFKVDSFSDEFKRDAEAFEAVIFDTIGTSIVTGFLEGNSVAFTKIYSESARQRGGSSDKIFYKGNFDERTGKYVGTFGFPDIKDAGKFNMTSGVRNKASLKR